MLTYPGVFLYILVLLRCSSWEFTNMKHAAKEKPNYKILCRHMCESVLSEHTFQKEIPCTDNVLLC